MRTDPGAMQDDVPRRDEAQALPVQRVTAIMDGRVTPLPSTPLATSAGSSWAGFLLERHVVRTGRQEAGWCWHNTHVGVCIAGPSMIEIEGAAGAGRYLVERGSLSLFPRGCERTDIRHWGGGMEFVVLELAGERLAALFQDEAEQLDRLAPQLYPQDGTMLALVSNMLAEVEAGCPSGALYGESLSLALAAYLSHRYAIAPGPQEKGNPCLSRSQSCAVLEYIDAHLGRDLTTAELGQLAGLSARRFARLFRNTFHTTVHGYVLAERIRRAKCLLAERRLPLIEISDTLGFASQSHFTDVFRRAAGVSPRRYREAR